MTKVGRMKLLLSMKLPTFYDSYINATQIHKLKAH
jgi:hypothetical protein